MTESTVMLVQAYLATGKTEEGLALSESLRKTSLSETDLFVLTEARASAFDHMDQLDAAVEEVSSALPLITTKARRAFLLSMLGNLLNQQRHPVEARTALEQSLELAPGDPETEADLGRAIRNIARLGERRTEGGSMIPDGWKTYPPRTMPRRIIRKGRFGYICNACHGLMIVDQPCPICNCGSFLVGHRGFLCEESLHPFASFTCPSCSRSLDTAACSIAVSPDA